MKDRAQENSDFNRRELSVKGKTKMSESKTVAVYLNCDGVDFVEYREFENEDCREAFIAALDLNASVAAKSDTDPYMEAFRIPEQLDEVCEFDDEFEERLEEYERAKK